MKNVNLPDISELDLSVYTDAELKVLIEKYKTLRHLEDLDACQSLVEFIRQAWHVLEPTQPYIHGWHMDALAEHLTAVTEGQITRLLINIPPGTMKSLATGVFWPAWEWGPRGLSHKRFIGASHEEGVATRDNLKMRRLVQSEWFQSRWPLKIIGDQNQKTYFELETTGWRQSCPVSSMTGRRGDCVLGDVIISTDAGPLTAEDIVNHAENCNALSFDHNTGQMVYRPVQAVAWSSSDEVYRVHTADGGLVECTGGHRFYTARGYVAANLLSEGDLLLRAVWEGGGAHGIRDEEDDQAGQGGGVLQRVVLTDTHKPQAWQARPMVQRLWGEDTKGASPMLGGVREDCSGKTRSLEENRSAKHILPDVQPGSEADDQGLHTDILLPQVRELWPLTGGPQAGEPEVEGRGGCEEVRPDQLADVSQDSQGHTGQGWQQVRLLRRAGRTVCSPPGHGHREQHLGKPSDALQELPCDVAQHLPGRSEQTAITLVERISRSTLVYDLQVEGTRNFFANGVLVHNCVLWDDPHSVEDAHSPAKLGGANRVFRETLPTRVNNPDKSAIIIVMQRLNQKDVAGEILSSGLGYEHLCLPMEYEGARKPTKIGFVDPRRTTGELLFPGRFPRSVVDRDKKIMGEYASAGQFQQRPAPAGGGILKATHFRLWPATRPVPDLFWIVQSYDTAYTEKTTGDPTACNVWGVFEFENRRQAILLDAWSDHLAYPDLKRKVLDDWTASYGGVKNDMLKPSRKPDVILVEAKGSGQSLLQDLNQSNVPAVAFNPGRADKVARGHLVSPLLEAGNFWVLESKRDKGQPISWARKFLEQVQTFPAGEHDDYVDCFTQCSIYLRQSGNLEVDVALADEPDAVDYHAKSRRLVNPYG